MSAAILIDRLIEAAGVFERLAPQELNGTQTETTTLPSEMCPIGTQILPTSERQVRPLTKLDPEQQREAWQQAVDEAGGKVPSGRIVEDIVQQIKTKTPVPNPYHVGEICWLVAKGDPQLKGKNRCWAVIKDVHEFSCTVQTWDGAYQVKIENLQSQELLPSQQEQIKQMCDRLQRLACFNSLDISLRAFLKKLGEQLSFTEVEEQVLSFLENYYLNKNGQASLKADKSFFLNKTDSINDSYKSLELSVIEEIPQGSTFRNQLQAISGKEDDNE